MACVLHAHDVLTNSLIQNSMLSTDVGFYLEIIFRAKYIRGGGPAQPLPSDFRVEVDWGDGSRWEPAEVSVTTPDLGEQYGHLYATTPAHIYDYPVPRFVSVRIFSRGIEIERAGVWGPQVSSPRFVPTTGNPAMNFALANR